VRELKVERASISSAGSRRFSHERREPGCQLAHLRPRNATGGALGQQGRRCGDRGNPLRRVLVVYSDERLLPANVIVDEAIRRTFATETTNRIEF
jgi:hypothetical protein